MSVEILEDEKEEAKVFLDTLLNDLPEEPGFSLKPNCYCMCVEEIEGEVIETVSRYVGKRNCPEVLEAAFSYGVAADVVKGNLTECELEKDIDVEDPVTTQYESSKLARSILQSIQKIGKQWKEEMPALYKNNINYEHCVLSIKNKRRKMEDKHIICTHFNTSFGRPKSTEPLSMFAVFDGHGGVDAAYYAASQFGIHLRHSLHDQKSLTQSVKEAFVKTDQGFVEKARRERLRSGCTGVTVLISRSKLHVGWLGDSQVVLCKDNHVVELMSPHKPDREDERQRIEALGGCVVWFGGWRVNGSLSVSRAIGDYEHKPYVSGDPDITEHTLVGDEKFLILGCDGLFDVISPEKAVQITVDYLLEGNSRETVAEMLVHQAKSSGSLDNITVLVVYLDDHVAHLCRSQANRVDVPKVIAAATDLSEYDVLEVTDVASLTPNGDVSQNEVNARVHGPASMELSGLKIDQDTGITKGNVNCDVSGSDKETFITDNVVGSLSLNNKIAVQSENLKSSSCEKFN